MKNEDAAVTCSGCGEAEFETQHGQAPVEATMEETLAVVKIFSSTQAADVAAATLRANGIECTIAADDGGGMLVNLQTSEGVRVLVPASRLIDAQELLESLDPG